MEAPLIEIGKSRGEEKCALRRFKEESELRFQDVQFVVLMEEIRVGLLSRCVVSVPEGERLSWEWCAGRKLGSVLLHRDITKLWII